MNDIQGDAWPGDVHADATLYAADALEPEERAVFEDHLRRCPECREEVGAIQEVGALLSAAVAQEPPPALRENVLAAVRGTRPGAVAPHEGRFAARTDGWAGNRASSVHGQRPAHRDDRQDRPGDGATVVSLAERRRPRARWLAAAAAAVLVPGAALGGWALGTQAEQREQQLVAQEQARQSRLLGSPDVTTHQLEVDGHPATLVVSEQEDAAMFVATDLPGPGEGREYQLWLMQDDVPVPDVHFGGGQVQVWLDGNVDRAAAVAMTVEPAGGSEEPTLPVLVATEI